VFDIPYPSTPLIGRSSEMAALRSLLGQDRVRLITFTGAGGAGKTRLAIELAEHLTNTFDRAWFVDLISVRSADLVPAAVAEAVGLKETGAAELDASLREMLSVGHFLLLLDNFEHVLQAGTYVVRLLSSCRDLLVLATSREALHVRSERVFQVEPLTVPRRDQLDDLAALRKFPSVELFEERARAVQPGFTLTQAVLPTVAEICLDLDGLPLAIELVASQAGLLTPREMLERLSARAPLVTPGPRDLAARHQTLDATIRWSYDLLTPETQRLFRLCSVFAGGFSLAAMSTIAGEDAVGTLSQLVAKNLVRMAPRPTGSSRYSLLDTVRAFALDRLIEAGELAAAQREHARYYVACAQELQASLRGVGMADALDNLESEYANFRAVFQWSTSEGGDLELGLRLAGALYRFWIARGHLIEARAWLEDALADADNVETNVRAVARNAAGVMAGMQHDHATAIAHFQTSLALWEELGEVAGQANAALNLGFVAQNLGDLDTAERQFEQAQQLYARGRDISGQANALASRARIARERGDMRQAVELFGESLPLARAIGDDWSIGNTLANLGQLLITSGDPTKARDVFRESLQVRLKLGNVVYMAESLEGLAGVMTNDQPRLAVRLLGAAERMRQTSGAPVAANEQERHAGIVARVRSRLTPTQFRASWNAGRALSDKTAIDIAMGVLPLPEDPPTDLPGAPLDVLSARERDIALLITEGYSNRAIADQLVLSVKTVETHVKHIFAKLHVRNRAGVAAAVERAGKDPGGHA
jgi:predicted ATPase/DNA-binding CsgD family transcriptional regulator